MKKMDALLEIMAEQEYEGGSYLKKNPFIPEYLGFVETIHKEKGLTNARIYTKDGYNMSKRVDTTRNEWIILDPNGVTNSLLIESMYSAIIILRACGMQISMYDYNLENRKMLQKMDEDIQKRLQADKELAEMEEED